MKRFISIFLIFLFLSLSMNPINVFAENQSKTLKQGIYNARDTNLLIGTPITVKLTSSNDRAIIIIIDSDQTIEALVRLNSRISQQILPPLNYDSSIIIFTNGSVIFS
ncbi:MULTISPECIES: hypothetical protein [unclassified Clostridium]|uniref:hypothetical protein n=1 Tax=unclassified Clostridium TaxID=2614128 RepID=UPI000298660E|nr:MULTISPECIES: hypothetical protein [unclassified Clostridium]EKQ52553.1 MAG: hypothetical protein A370_04122 [Clostridium sp. Maddingley MBC34-26]